MEKARMQLRAEPWFQFRVQVCVCLFVGNAPGFVTMKSLGSLHVPRRPELLPALLHSESQGHHSVTANSLPLSCVPGSGSFTLNHKETCRGRYVKSWQWTPF